MNLNDILRELGFKPHPSNWKHFSGGFLLGAFAFVFTFYEIEWSLWASIGIGTGFAFFGGLIKELWDKKNFDWLDLIMTTAGGFAGCMIGATTTLFL